MSDDVFDALNPKGRRRSASRRVLKPDDVLQSAAKKDALSAEALDVRTNMSLLGWMIRRTQDYCCLFDFHPMTGDDGFDRDLRYLMTRDCLPGNNDVNRRMSWDDQRRAAEAIRILVGDAFFVTQRNGSLQLMSGVECRNPETVGEGRWINGAKLAVNSDVVQQWNFRTVDLANGYKYTDRQVSVNRVWQHMLYETSANVIRPVSPIASLLNEMRDLYETCEYARAKAKLDQLFGLAVFTDDDDDDIAETVDADGHPEDDSAATAERHYDFGSGPTVMNLRREDKIELLTANNPGKDTQEFLKLCIQLVLLGLDLPANFWNPSETNFFGSRAAWNMYERSCYARREAQLRLHARMTRWRLFRWSLDVESGGTGEITLPRNTRLQDVRFRWIPRGVPWWKPQEELHAGLQEVAAGLATFQELCDRGGRGLWRENIRTIQEELKEAESLGFTIAFNPARLDVTIAGGRSQQPAKQNGDQPK